MANVCTCAEREAFLKSDVSLSFFACEFSRNYSCESFRHSSFSCHKFVKLSTFPKWLCGGMTALWEMFTTESIPSLAGRWKCAGKARYNPVRFLGGFGTGKEHERASVQRRPRAASSLHSKSANFGPNYATFSLCSRYCCLLFVLSAFSVLVFCVVNHLPDCPRCLDRIRMIDPPESAAAVELCEVPEGPNPRVKSVPSSQRCWTFKSPAVWKNNNITSKNVRMCAVVLLRKIHRSWGHPHWDTIDKGFPSLFVFHDMWENKGKLYGVPVVVIEAKIIAFFCDSSFFFLALCSSWIRVCL